MPPVRLGPFRRIVNVGWGTTWLLAYGRVRPANNALPPNGDVDISITSILGASNAIIGAGFASPHVVTQENIASGAFGVHAEFNYDLSEPIGANHQGLRLIRLSGGPIITGTITLTTRESTNALAQLRLAKQSAIIGKTITIQDNVTGIPTIVGFGPLVPYSLAAPSGGGVETEIFNFQIDLGSNTIT